jgi:hypothetical protein
VKTWHVCVLAAAVVCGFALHAAFPRYRVESFRFGAGGVVIKTDRWTGNTWRYSSGGWLAVSDALNPFDQFDSQPK